jgi:hypothetical protein
VSESSLRVLRREPFERLIIGGLWETLPQFESRLHRYLRDRIVARWDIDVHTPTEQDAPVRYWDDPALDAVDSIAALKRFRKIAAQRIECGRKGGVPGIIPVILCVRPRSAQLASASDTSFLSRPIQRSSTKSPPSTSRSALSARR